MRLVLTHSREHFSLFTIPKIHAKMTSLFLVQEPLSVSSSRNLLESFMCRHMSKSVSHCTTTPVDPIRLCNLTQMGLVCGICTVKRVNIRNVNFRETEVQKEVCLPDP